MEKDILQIQTSLKEVSDQLKATAEQHKVHAETHTKLSGETKEKVDALLVQQGELQARLQAAEQKMVTLDSRGGDVQTLQSMGFQVADSEEWAAFASSKPGKGSSHNFSVKAAITSATGSGGALVEPTRVPGIVGPGLRRLTVRDLLNWGRTTSNSVEYVRELGFTNNANVVSENPSAGKPESQLTFEPDSAPVATIAHWIRASRQILDDAPMLQSYIDGRLTYGLKLVEENQLLNGSGVGLNINGLVTQASAYANPGVSVVGETAIDRLRIAMLQVELAEYYADGVVLNPIQWTEIELTKETTRSYIMANPAGIVGPTLWGRPVVSTSAMADGDFLVGSFQMGAQGWDRQDVNVTVSFEDRDNFIKNMATILVEERLALTVFRPEAFVTGDFAGLPSA
jgi:HK97 family phage major capsid protein